ASYTKTSNFLVDQFLRAALDLTKSVTPVRLRPSHREFRQLLETISKTETALAELLKRCKADGVIDPDEIVMLLTATSNYRTLNPNNREVNARHDELLQQFQDLSPTVMSGLAAEHLGNLPPELFSMLPSDRLSSIPGDILARLPVDQLVLLPSEILLKLPPFRNSLGIMFRLIPAGEFLMGSDSVASMAHTDEKPQHRVRITKPFYLGVFPVTKAEYLQVVRSNPYPGQRDDRHPITYVSWDHAEEFCRRLSDQEGVTYSLPTEAQWEYACRAGSAGCWCFGNDESLLRQYAWYKENAGKRPHLVGQRKPNAWGLHDMHGNVWECCSDRWDENYYRQFAGQLAVDPHGPTAGSHRVIRGGCWRDGAWVCRAAYREKNLPSDQDFELGFRLARAVS
ncbi:MAG: formylglycine-generating enzyme family protein, partial [Pirellulaceae bacterium]|nr:formylglycine-generating enzyme family protein [Pirellulaceae bacterium]